MTYLALFASGTGSNARQLMEYFAEHPDIRVGVLVSNKPDAGALQHAEEMGVPTLVINRESFYNTENLLVDLDLYRVDWIVLAGFLWLVPAYLVHAYAGRIVNIHPALLPRFGGRGMYGMRVHEAVKAAGETQSGMTIHYVNEQYDEGAIIFQATCTLEEHDTPEDIALKVQALEHRHYPEVVERVVEGVGKG
ncbi:MAG: phosphoribosylglycinamide formyltransferase [Saprospiraceae bacterium]